MPDNPPDVIVLNDYASANGGSSIVALNSARELARRGGRVTLFTAVGPEIDGLENICLHQQEIVSDPNRLRAIGHGLHNFSAARALRRALAGRDPRRTILHVHTYTKALSASVIAAGLDLGFPVVLSLHDFFITCPTGGFFVHKDAALCLRRPLSLDCVTCSCDRRNYGHKLWRTARTALQNRVLKLDRRLTHLIGISDFSVKIMEPYLPTTTPVTVVRNPVQCEDLGPAPVAENAPFVFIGRFSREKGPLLFAEAVAKSGVPALFIGDGELRAEAERIAPGATFTGWLPEHEVRAQLRRARALVFPPLWYETLGLVVIEAAAAGIPAIVASRCAATDFIRHDDNGLVFEHGSVDALCEQMHAMQNPSTAARLGQAAYRWHWDNPWTVERHVDDLLAVYDRALTAA